MDLYNRNKRALTLIELLVVISIITLLAVILMPGMGRARTQARTTICANNLHQVMLGLQEYHTEYEFEPMPSHQFDVRPHSMHNVGDLLRDHITNAEVFVCPASPYDPQGKYWGVNSPKLSLQEYYLNYHPDNIVTPLNCWEEKVAISSYWMLWGYERWQETGFNPKKNPKHDLMASDLFYYGRDYNKLGEESWVFNHQAAGANQTTWFWKLNYPIDEVPRTLQNAGYKDGHVESSDVRNWIKYSYIDSQAVCFPDKWR